MQPLFRQEAVAHATRLEGRVLLPASVSVWLIGAVLAAVLGLAIWFATTATYARTETVQGWLSPAAGTVRVVASGRGVVSALLVAKGDVVERGAPLARIGLLDQSDGERGGPMLLRSLRTQREARERALRATVRRLALGAERLDARRSLLRDELADVEVELAAAGPARSDLTRAAKRLERELFDVTKELETIPEAEAVARAEAEGALAGIDERLARLAMEVERVVHAPVGGRITALPVRIGHPVTPGACVAVVVPDDSELVAELFVPSRAAGFVAVGQPLRLKYDAFPFQRFGAQDGVVAEVSPAVLSPEESGYPAGQPAEPVFRVRGRLAEQRLDAYGTDMPLRAGMRLTADIVVDRRTLVEWLLDPLYAVGRR